MEKVLLGMEEARRGGEAKARDRRAAAVFIRKLEVARRSHDRNRLNDVCFSGSGTLTVQRRTWHE
jgi:hypothetical protein